MVAGVNWLDAVAKVVLDVVAEVINELPSAVAPVELAEVFVNTLPVQPVYPSPAHWKLKM